ncbi:uncharacterized protein BT62DRAFT_1005191 [Guyanagaster necrorhizus]|uniref:Transmembrane protein n=1 Tax=Guyanagaster necrorhizus TaxID=856835 RepID=A0A9P7VVT5_9AGAR|nr:uncharacterized protein BT62DRAFT_1005191 [Guyanagaster necrorhizus MCA 3950]KAG7446801.1 hypothetical protein BT62DRAFT_1005191 [Guyanagaster necrorhizus MCA 3950]
MPPVHIFLPSLRLSSVKSRSAPEGLAKPKILPVMIIVALLLLFNTAVFGVPSTNRSARDNGGRTTVPSVLRITAFNGITVDGGHAYYEVLICAFRAPTYLFEAPSIGVIMAQLLAVGFDTTARGDEKEE